MRIADILERKQTFSFEIFPPKGEMSQQTAAGIADELAACGPDYISVTFSAGGTGSSANTVAIADRIQRDHPGVASLAHLTCMGATRETVDGYVAELKAAGVDNVLALRGDRVAGREPIDFTYASDLIAYLKGSGLCIGAACYPEGHVECPDFAKSIEHLKAKQDAGVDFLVTQLFFDNELFYRFREALDRARIKVPVVVGIMPFTSEGQVKRMSFTCGATIPSKLIKRIVAAGGDDDAVRAAGVEYACEQLVDLSRNGVDGLHVYTMNRPEIGRATRDALAAAGYLG